MHECRPVFIISDIITAYHNAETVGAGLRSNVKMQIIYGEYVSISDLRQC